MAGPDALRDDLARVICAAWWAACELPQTWDRTPPEQRATFADMADCALIAARAGQRTPAGMAVALHHGFYRGFAGRAWGWETLGGLKREVFVTVAREVLAAGRAWREAAEAAKAGSTIEVKEEAHA